ncbi:MAG: hypothetical protein Q7V62_11340, partial [Actinomycetota bacterium]|nr:hypothetical protein [Actinomycetota bacterium]
MLIITPDFPPGRGGIQQLMGKLAGHLEARSVRVFTLAARDATVSPADSDAVLPRGVRVTRLHMPRFLGHRIRVIAFNLCAALVGLFTAHRTDAVVVGHIVASPAARTISF